MDVHFTDTSAPASAQNLPPQKPPTAAAVDPDTAKAAERQKAGESIQHIAASMGITPRALRVRLGKYARLQDPLAAAKATLPRTPRPSIPAGDKPEETKADPQAIEKLAASLTPEVLVDTLDAIGVSLTTTGVFLAAPHLRGNPLLKEHLPMSPVEKGMLIPWASFATQHLPQILRDHPEAGLYIFLGLYGYIQVNRVVMLVGLSREIKAAEKKAAAQRKLEKPPIEKAPK